MADVPSPVRVVLIDDDPFFLRGLRSVLDEAGIQVIGEATDGVRAIDRCRANSPDVVILGVSVQGPDWLDVVRALTAVSHVVVMSRLDDDDTVVAALAAGAHGYLVHGRFGVGELLRAVYGSARGETHLSPAAAPAAVRLAQRQALAAATVVLGGLSKREIQLLDLVSRGWSNAQIAHELFLAEKTVKNHLTRAFAKLGTRNRAEAAAVYTGRARPVLDDAPATDLAVGTNAAVACPVPPEPVS